MKKNHKRPQGSIENYILETLLRAACYLLVATRFDSLTKKLKDIVNDPDVPLFREDVLTFCLALRDEPGHEAHMIYDLLNAAHIVMGQLENNAK